MKIVLILNILNKLGGAERSFINLANSLSKNHNLEIHIISFEKNCATSFYPLNSNILWTKIDDASSNINSSFFRRLHLRFIKRSFLLKKVLQKIAPEIVISFINFTNIYSTLVCKSLNIPIIISERNNPLKKRMPWRWELIRNIIYPFANAIVIQTKKASLCYSKRIQTICEIIPNIVLEPDSYAEAKINIPSPYIASLGRLRYVKGFDILIKAFAKISNDNPDWKLIIIGEGIERINLENLIKQLNMENKIFLPGLDKKPHNIISKSDIFVLSSRWEGFPNSLAEAMALGASVISTNCNFGPQEIITHEVDGILIENENIDQLSDALKKLIDSEKLRTELGLNAEKILEKFGEKHIVNLWQELINKVTTKKA